MSDEKAGFTPEEVQVIEDALSAKGVAVIGVGEDRAVIMTRHFVERLLVQSIQGGGLVTLTIRKPVLQ